MGSVPDGLQAIIPRTRLLPPQIGADMLPRPALVERLQQAVVRHPLTLVSAPAGSGKTTLVASWLATQPSQSTIWLRLTEAEDDLEGFFLALLTTLRQLDPDFGQDWQALLTTDPDINRARLRLAAILINEIMAASITPFTLVLDDLHFLQNPAVVGVLDSLLAEMPAGMRLVATSRYDPPLALARLRVQGRLAEFRLEDLRFAVDEAYELLNDRLQLKLRQAELEQLQGHTAGWIAGLRLLALSLSPLDTMSKRTAFLQNLTLSGRHLFDFLVQEIFAAQSQAMQHFLLVTSILAELTPAYCRAVTEDEHAPQQLEEAFRHNLFLTVVAGADGVLVYQYHDLFAQFLRQQLAQRLSASEIQALHRRAANAMMRIDARIHHFLEARCWSEAIKAITQAGMAQLEQGFVQPNVKRWIDLLPAESVTQQRDLQLLLGAVAYRSGHMAEARTSLEKAATMLRDAGDDVGFTQAQIRLSAALLELEGPEVQLAILKSLRLELLPVHLQVLAHLILVWTYFPRYNWADAEAHFSRAISLTLSSGDERAYRMVAQHIGVPLYFGDLGMAPIRQFCQQALARFGEGNGIIQMGVYLQLALMAAVEGRLNEIMPHVEKVMAISQRLGGFGYIDQNVGFAAGLLAMAHDDFAAGQTALDNALREADQRGQFRALLAGLAYFLGRAGWIAGDVRRVQDMRQLLDSLDNRLQPLEAEATRALLDALVADLEGNRMGAERAALEAIQLQNRFKHPANTGCTRLFLAELYLRWNRPSQALSLAQQGLAEWARRAMPGVPLLHGSRLIPVLELAISNGVYKQFAQDVLGAFPGQARVKTVAVPETGLTLTPRETEVLYLLIEGASNRTIAERLVISERTVKSHVSKVLAKLNATSRSEAAAKARIILT